MTGIWKPVLFILSLIVPEGLELGNPGLPDFPPMWFFDGVDVGSSGDIYIRGGEANVIHKIRQNKVR